ncbi:uncharacterized protein LOC123529363 [Mercenaria mercenaria]|uniref:uncharacterized protein LOC123529363 n=1 Tax=Mercenaria mercenaria TaxID=6596 RepID=UPI00234F3585|nr:uncharacterized protein LOC123529363 [Mercenaria mercenaria]
MNYFAVLLFFGLAAIATCQIVGAPEDATYTDEVTRMAKFAVGEIGSEYAFVKVISGTRQLVNGLLYNIELVAKRIIKGQKNKRRRCKVIVYEVAHEGYLELEEFHCHFNNKPPRL